MTQIGNVDHVLLLLRAQLQRSNRKQATLRGSPVNRATASPMERARALAELDELSDEEVGEAVVRGLLTEQFGEALANDASFQAMLDDVVRIIRTTPEGTQLIEAATRELRGG